MIVPCPEQAVSSGLLMDMGVSGAERATHEECWWPLWGKFLSFWSFCLFRRGPCHHRGLTHLLTRHLHWRRHQLLRDRLDPVEEKDGGCLPRSGLRGTGHRDQGTRGHSQAARTGACVHPETEKIWGENKWKNTRHLRIVLCQFLSPSLCCVLCVAFQVCHVLRFTCEWMVCTGSLWAIVPGAGVFTPSWIILWEFCDETRDPGSSALWQWLDNGDPPRDQSAALFSVMCRWRANHTNKNLSIPV